MYLMNKQKKQKLSKIVGYQKEKQRNKLRQCWLKKKKKFKGLEQLQDVSGAGVSNMKEMCGLMEYLFANGCSCPQKG